MLPLEKLKAVKHIVTHENCADGIASAIILKNILSDAKVTFLHYETDAHILLKPEEGMLFCDFSPHKNSVAAFKEAGALVLDHHKTQKGVVEAFGENGVFADEKAEPGVCGAVLAFREVWLPLHKQRMSDGVEPANRSGLLMKEFAEIAGVRDTWQRKDPRWLQACEQAEALTFWPVEEVLRLASEPDEWRHKLGLGPMLYKRRLQSAEKAIKNGVAFHTSKGRTVLVFEGLKQTSDAAELLGDKFDFVVGFGFTPEHGFPYLTYSTRSHKGFDCSAFAQAHGGGGHTAAAGFKVQLIQADPQPYTLMQHLMGAYESVEDQWLQVLAEKKEGFKAAEEYGKLSRDHIQDTYLLRLDKYQRDNLVWLFKACGYPNGPDHILPFVFANSGDWLGEIALMLDCEKGVGKPNRSLDALRESVESWLHSRRIG